MILLTTHAQAQEVRAALASAAAGYLAKVDAFLWLAEAIQRVHRGQGDWLSPLARQALATR